ncbi:dual specificity protein phosphatase 23-like [Clavelina lepadiformis]|uniref:dual specificity protein phosphatase 23-like n=1 Tax=Clavelina lepadiformis TaxID=159417 RepID=UPI0040435A7B
MDGRVFTAVPSSRRRNTDVTFHRVFSSDRPFIFGNGVPRPLTTSPSARRSTAESPPNFSWVDKGWLAGCAMPTNSSHYRFLFESGVRHVISLMKQRPQGALESIQLPKLNRLKIRIDDFCAPSLNQIKQFVRIVEDANDRKEAVAVHCENGNGRSGTMLACYLAKTRRISGSDALREIRKLRPGSVESLEQEKAIEQYHHHLRSENQR